MPTGSNAPGAASGSKEPLPRGCALRHTLRSAATHSNWIAWAPEGNQLAAAGDDHTIAVWHLDGGAWRQTLRGHQDEVNCVAWSPDGRTLASAAKDCTISFWEMETGIRRESLAVTQGPVRRLLWLADGLTLALVSQNGSISLWDVGSRKRQHTLLTREHPDHISGLALSPDAATLASGSRDGTVRLWDAAAGSQQRKLRGHSGAVTSVAWSPDGKTLASGSWDNTIRCWDVHKRRQTRILEGHTDVIMGLAFSADGQVLASRSKDGTVRLWRSDRGDLLAVLPAAGGTPGTHGIAFHPVAPLLATLADEGKAIQVWELDLATLLDETPTTPSVHYANAKVVLVGDTGVGKSGLGLVLAGLPFTATDSTHGRHVWVMDSRETELCHSRLETRETFLWDLAGQPGYRLIHQLHLSEVAVALVVFDSRNEVDPFAGVRHWDRALRQAQRIQSDAAAPLAKYLVAARIDRGGIGVSVARIQTLVRDLGFAGYFEVSAKEGWGIAELAEAVRKAIDWEALPRVSSTSLFQNIKDLLLEEKQAGRFLTTGPDLYRTFLKTPGAPGDTADLRSQFETGIGRAESRGLIRRLSFGNFILLQPELLDAYASALIQAAKDEPDGLGSMAEEDVREGRFRMPEGERLSDKVQEKLLLIAMVDDLLRHEIALREQADDGPHLVFPSQLTREHPGLSEPEGKTVIFTFEGPVLNVYATLAVRLSHSGLFNKKELWQNAAMYTALVGGTCGIFLKEIEEGRGELTLLFDKSASRETRCQFEEYIRSHLVRRAVPESIQRRRILVCEACGTPLTDLQVRRRRERGFDWIACSVCDERVSFGELQEPFPDGVDGPVTAMDQTADACRDLDAGLVSASGEMRTQDFMRWAGAAKTTLALVFTDILGSTALTNELGNEAMAEVRRTHFRQGRSLLQNQGGYAVKTMGDAMMVAFRTAVEALDFALALAREPGHDRVKIRAGIHVGQVSIKGGDAFGAMVNYTARVANSAGGPELWVSDRAKGDIDEEKAKAHGKLRWQEHLDCELKGFSGSHRLWSVEVAGLGS
jgi:WD40 repeat protein/class 3 adenylate cyclase